MPRNERGIVLPPLQLFRQHFHVSVVKMAVDKAESGLVHSGVGAGQDASPYSVKSGKKDGRFDLVLTRLH